MSETIPLLEAANLGRVYRSRGGLFGARAHTVHAVRDVSLDLYPAEVFGLVGESGSGKSTLARLLMALERPDQGRVVFDGAHLQASTARELRAIRRKMQMVFQNPYGALNPLQPLLYAITEPLGNFEPLSRSERARVAAQALDEVGLPQRLLRAYPHQLSGGERQRACIARALSVKPALLICDEAVSALDKTVQAQVMILLKELQQRHRLAMLFISHDLAVVNYLCDRVAVMLKGDIVESGTRADVLFGARHPYTQALLGATKYFERGLPLTTRSSDPQQPVRGCAFQFRCTHANGQCREAQPPRREISASHWIRCFRNDIEKPPQSIE